MPNNVAGASAKTQFFSGPRRCSSSALKTNNNFLGPNMKKYETCQTIALRLSWLKVTQTTLSEVTTAKQH